MQAADSETAVVPGHRLFSSNDVAVATFLGSILAGSIVLAINFFRVGRPGAGKLSIAGGAVGLGILSAVAWLVNDSVPNVVFTAVNLGLTFGMKAVAEVLQDPALSAHREAGGRVGAGWPAAGIGLASLVVIVGALFLVMFRFDPAFDRGDSVNVGKITAYYKDGATETEARKVGMHLRALGIEKEIDIQVLRRDGVPHILFIAAEGTSTDEFRDVGRSIAMDVFGGAPVVVNLADEYFEVHTSVEAGPP